MFRKKSNNLDQCNMQKITEIKNNNIECLSAFPGWKTTNLPYNYAHTTKHHMQVTAHSVKRLSPEQQQQLWDLLDQSEKDFYSLLKKLDWVFPDTEKPLHITLFNAYQPYNPDGHGQPNYNPFPPGLAGVAQYHPENLPNGDFQLTTLIDIPFETFPSPLGKDGNDFCLRHELGHVYHFYLNNGSTSIWPAVSDGFADFTAKLNRNFCDDIWQTQSMPLLRDILITKRDFANQYIRGRWFIMFMRENNPAVLRDLLGVNHERHRNPTDGFQTAQDYIRRYEEPFAEWLLIKQCSCPAAKLCESDGLTTAQLTATSSPANPDVMQALFDRNPRLQQYLQRHDDNGVAFVFFSKENKAAYCWLNSRRFFCSVTNSAGITIESPPTINPIQQSTVLSIIEMYIYGDNCAETPLEIRLSSPSQPVDKQRLQEDIIKIFRKHYRWKDLQQAAEAAGVPSDKIKFLTSEYLHYQSINPLMKNEQRYTTPAASTQNCTSYRTSLADQYPKPTLTFISPTSASPLNQAELLQNLFNKNPHLQQYIKNYPDVGFAFFSERENNYCRLNGALFYCMAMDPQLTAQQKITALRESQQASIYSILEMYVYGDNCAKTPLTIMLSYLRQYGDAQGLQNDIIKIIQEGYQWNHLQQAAEAVGVSSDKIEFLTSKHQHCFGKDTSCARNCTINSGNPKNHYLLPPDNCINPHVQHDDFSVINQIHAPSANQSVDGTSSTVQPFIKTAGKTLFPFPQRLAIEVGIGIINGLIPLALKQVGKKLKRHHAGHEKEINAFICYVAHPSLSASINLARIPLSGAVFWEEDANLLPSLGFYFGCNFALAAAIKSVQFFIQRCFGEGKISQAFNFIIYINAVVMFCTSQDFNENPVPATLGYTANILASMAAVALITFADGMVKRHSSSLANTQRVRFFSGSGRASVENGSNEEGKRLYPKTNTPDNR